MRRNLLHSVVCKINSVRGIRSDLTRISFNEPNAIMNSYCCIKLGVKPICITDSIIKYPFLKIWESANAISCLDLKVICSNETYLVLKFIPDFSEYNESEYSKIIIKNIEKLYNRISNYFNEVYEVILRKFPVKANEEKIEFTERAFKLILFQIKLKNFNSYEEITDKIIISILVDYFNSNL